MERELKRPEPEQFRSLDKLFFYIFTAGLIKQNSISAYILKLLVCLHFKINFAAYIKQN